MGRFRHLAREDRWEWSDEVAQIHGYLPGSVTPTTELLVRHQHPDEKPVVVELAERVYRDGVSCSNRHRIIDTEGWVHLVVVVGHPLLDDHGEVAGTEGCYVDLTEQFEADMQKRLTDAVTAINTRRAVINQAMGIVMLQYGLDADAAFELLARMSQRSNIKLRVLAERFVGDAVARESLLNDAANEVSGLARV
ncbi:transcriptional regulator [Mycobacterium sp. 1423905.2]|nr:transcriptional regulator [Mycobacterium sp. 1423905.2]